MSVNESDFMSTAQQIAWAAGSDVIIGVRPNGTWFAHCDGVEWDGSPDEALEGVRAGLISRQQAALATATSIEERLFALKAIRRG